MRVRELTRDMTPEELQQLNEAYRVYLSNSRKATSVTELERAWRTYVAYRDEQGIISTLAGYRVLKRSKT